MSGSGAEVESSDQKKETLPPETVAMELWTDASTYVQKDIRARLSLSMNELVEFVKKHGKNPRLLASMIEQGKIGHLASKDVLERWRRVARALGKKARASKRNK